MIEAKNKIDSLIYSTEKSLIDNSYKLDAETKPEVKQAFAQAKEVNGKHDLDASTTHTPPLSQAQR